MESFEGLRIKWPYVTHRVIRSTASGLLPAISERNPGSLLLARVLTIGKHKDLEAVSGRRLSLFPGDVFVGALGDRYATDQFEGAAVCTGETGHILGIGGVCGQVMSKNERMPDPTTIQWLGRLADRTGRPLQLGDFALPTPARRASPRPTTILSVGAAMNAGKTTTAAQMIRSLVGRGFRVAAAKITGTACRKDPGFLEDAGAVRVLDFTHCGFPSTANLSREELLGLAGSLRAALLEDNPDFLVYEIADGIVQRETRMLLEDPGFRETIDAVTFAAPDSLSCESGGRLLRGLGYPVVFMAGIVANSALGIAEVEQATGIPCLNGQMILEGGPLLEVLDRARAA